MNREALNNTIAEKEELEEKWKQKVYEAWAETNWVENTLKSLQITFDRVCRDRDFYHGKLGEISYLLEGEIAKNQVAHDTLKSVVLEREQLIKKLTTEQQQLLAYRKALQKSQNKKQNIETELTPWKLWFPNQTPPNIANSFSKLDNQFNQVKKEAKRWKRKYQQVEQQLNSIPADWQQQITNANLAQQQAEIERDNQVNIIIQQLNNSLNLNLENSTLSSVISTIRELINKPPLTVANETIQHDLEAPQATIIRLEKELKEVEKLVNVPIATPLGEDLETIKNIDLTSLKKELEIELSPEIRQQIQKANSYQELSSLRNKEIKKYLTNKQVSQMAPNQVVKSNHAEWTILISLLVVSLLTIGGLLVKAKQSKKLK